MTVIKRRYNNTWRVLSGGVSEATAPLPPRSVLASSTVAGEANVSWTAPSDDGGSAITGYTVNSTRVSDGTTDSQSADGMTLTTTFSGLEVGELYSFTVVATNDYGGSTPSDSGVVMVAGGSGISMPTLATVGPRVSMTRTMTGAEARDELRETGYLSRVRVTSMLNLIGSDGINWVIEDCIIEATSLYGVRGYLGSDEAFTGTPAERPVFRHVAVVGRAANSPESQSSTVACVSARDIILINCNIYAGQDGVKARHRVEMYGSWVHDNDHPSGAHADAVQIVSGTDIVFIGNRFDSYEGYSSDGVGEPDGSTSNAVLQTGTVTGNISALWENNWFAGGHYTIRAGGGDSRVNFTFRNNLFRRYGESVALGLTDLEPNRYGAVNGRPQSNGVWENNTWEDTGELVD